MGVSFVKQARRIYAEYPQPFWVLIGSLFVDRLGGAMVFPFFSLYITQKFGVGMTEVGWIFTVYSISSVIGNLIGGALTDRVGRKRMLLFGLFFSGLTSLLMGFIGSYATFFILAIVVGLFSNFGGPAQQAMMADLLPLEQRAQGFGILRVVANLAIVIGPALGGLFIGYSYMIVFVADAILSSITALIVYWKLPETAPDLEVQSFQETFQGYKVVLRHTAFMLFMLTGILLRLTAMQMSSTLAVYLRDSYGIPPRNFGYLLSLNALLVVLLQFSITRRTVKYPPLLVMAAGAMLYAVGYGMFGLVATYGWFIVAVVILTFGEMFTAPTGQALVAEFAPEAMRGRYMAVYEFSWVIPAAIGPLLAGLVMDNTDPRFVWYAAFIVGMTAACLFVLLWRLMLRHQAAAQTLQAGSRDTAITSQEL